jgi:caffeoyl-CoA O-methyltransferase
MSAVARALRPVTPAAILGARLAALCERAAGIDGLDGEFCAQLREAQLLASGLEPYVAACTSAESPALAGLARRTRERNWAARDPRGATVELEPEMLSGHVEGVTLRFLVRMLRARRVLELGMFTGYSALALAEALPEDGRVIACELDPEVAEVAREEFAGAAAGSRIDIRVGPALDTLRSLADAGERFDLVFVDADKSGYVRYVSTILDEQLLAEAGVICVDNTLMQGEPWLPGEPSANGAAIATFNATIAGDPRVEQVLLPVRDGITLIRRIG